MAIDLARDLLDFVLGDDIKGKLYTVIGIYLIIVGCFWLKLWAVALGII